MSVLDTIDRPARTARDGLDRILLASLEALAAAGETDAACPLAGQACPPLRQPAPLGCRRFNPLLHRPLLRPPDRAAKV